MIEKWFVGFYPPYIRDLNGKLTLKGLLGHCEMWGRSQDGTWVFIDPQAKGTIVRVMHKHDDVMRSLNARLDVCAEILAIDAKDPNFRFFSTGFQSCASICGAVLGLRALLPATLRQKLLANDAEVIKWADPEKAQSNLPKKSKSKKLKPSQKSSAHRNEQHL